MCRLQNHLRYFPARVAMVAMAENASLADSAVTFLKD
jgi:hypothetical protein